MGRKILSAKFLCIYGKVIIGVFLFLVAFSVVAGDIATFVNLGFSPDSRYFMFGQYGIQQTQNVPYSKVQIVDVKKNDFVPNGGGEYYGRNSIESANSGLGALVTLLEENFEGRYKSYQIDHLNSGRLLYILLDGDEPSPKIDFRDFVAGTRYRVKVVQSVSGLDSDVTSTFYLVLSIDESDGTKSFTVGSPNYSRKHVHNYVVRQVILAPNGRALVFLIERNEYDSDGYNIRYMVETIAF